MPAYFIVQNTIKDEAQYQKYVQAVVPFIASFGGKLVARRAKVAVLEGEHGAAFIPTQILWVYRHLHNRPCPLGQCLVSNAVLLRSIPSPGERVPAEQRVFAQAMKQSNCRGENGRLAEAWPGPRNTNLRSST